MLEDKVSLFPRRFLFLSVECQSESSPRPAAGVDEKAAIPTVPAGILSGQARYVRPNKTTDID